MGTINCESIINNKLSFEQIGLLFQKTINIKEIPTKDKYLSIQYNILEEYNYLKTKSSFNIEIFQVSKKCRNISSFIPLIKEKQIFIKWIKILYNFNNKNDFKKKKAQKIPNDKIFQDNLELSFLNNRKEFMKLVSAGLPHHLRQFIWTIIIDKSEIDIYNISNNEREKIHLKTLTAINKNTKDIEQIEKDVYRTFVYEKDKTEKNIYILRQLLIALNNLNENIGYCQGLNFLVAFILKVTNFNIVKAFHLSRLILRKIKGYFSKDFPLLNNHLKTFNEGFKNLFPKLYSHFKNNDLVNEIWIGKWIQTLFTINLPFEETCYIWDALFAYGIDFIMPISLSIIYFIENNLLELKDSSDIISYLKETLTPSPHFLLNKSYKMDIKINNYIIPVYEIISNAKTIRNQLNMGIWGGIENRLRSMFDNRKITPQLISSNNSIFNYETKMEKIKTKKNSENNIYYKGNNTTNPSQSSTRDLFQMNNKNQNNEIQKNNKINFNNNNINKYTRVNKFYTVHHKSKQIKQPIVTNNINNNANKIYVRHLSHNNIHINNQNKKNFNFNTQIINKPNINILFFKNYNDYLNNNSNKKNINLFQQYNNNCNYNNRTSSINIYKESSSTTNLSDRRLSNNNIGYPIQNPLNLYNVYSHQLKNMNTLYNNNLQNLKVYPYLNRTSYNYLGQAFNPYNKMNINMNNNSKTITYSSNPYLTLNYRKNLNMSDVNKIKIKQKIINQIYNTPQYINHNIITMGVNEFNIGEKYRNTIPQFNNIKIIN